MAQELRPDICVIGAGAGGLAAAAAAAAMGATVALVEKGKMGGQDLNTASLPSKALIAAAERVNALRQGTRFSVKSVRFSVDFAAVHAHVHEAMAAVAPQDARERFSGLGVRVLAGTARFTDESTVAVEDVTIKARRIIIATGSSPLVPAIPGLIDTPHLTSETVFDLIDCPRHLIIVGAGRVGLELAQAFRRLGSEVTVLEAATPLASEVPECAAILLDALAREGITLRAGVKIAQVRRVLARVEAVIASVEGAASAGAATTGAATTSAGTTGAERPGTETIEGSHLLVAAGRRPNVDDLNLDAAGIRHSPHGVIIDRGLRTTNKRVYAIGDVAGGRKSSHLASHQAVLAVRHALFRVPVRVNRRAIAFVTYTDPELAQVGLLEDAARAQAGAIRVLRWPYRENGRAQATGATSGHIKVITGRRGNILGATIVGAQAGENIALWALAIGQKLNIRALAGLVVPYPTYAEVGKRAAITYFMRGLTSARVRRVIGWLRRLG